jgi:predicted alpha/beta-hydrolase family hydrolase
MLAAEEPALVQALLIFSYPLHPPGKPSQLRTAHLSQLQTPIVVVHGSEDPFATTAEIQAALKVIPAETALVEIDGGGHDLYGRGKNVRSDLPQMVITEFTRFVAQPASEAAGS